MRVNLDSKYNTFDLILSLIIFPFVMLFTFTLIGLEWIGCKLDKWIRG